MKKTKPLIFLILLVSLMPSLAFAKMMGGKVTAVNSASHELTLSVVGDSASGETAKFEVQNNTAFAGAGSLADLKEGDEVWVEAEEEAGIWKAHKITKA